jgi:hypothetical protein
VTPSDASELARIASAIERIANAVEARTPITINLDGKTLSHQVIRYTLRHAARGASSLVGGSLATDERKDG